MLKFSGFPPPNPPDQSGQALRRGTNASDSGLCSPWISASLCQWHKKGCTGQGPEGGISEIELNSPAVHGIWLTAALTIFFE